MAKQNKLTVIGFVLTFAGVGAYAIGIMIGNPHITAFSTEVGGAGLVTALVSLLK
jgi:hypothetical protein